MPAMEVYFLSINCGSVIISGSRLLTKSFRFRSANEIVQVENVQIIESLFTVPPSEDVQIIADLVAGVGSSAARWIILRHGSKPSHFVLIRIL